MFKTVLLNGALSVMLGAAAVAEGPDAGGATSASRRSEISLERQLPTREDRSGARDQRESSAVGQNLRDRVRARRGGAVEKSMGQSMTLGGRDVSVWMPAAPGPAPLVLFSHGFKGCPTQVTFLTQALADDGFVVMAPKHADASCGNDSKIEPEESFRDPSSWTDATYLDRRDDMVAVLDALRNDAGLKVRIDFGRIGLMGHSLGGYTVLGLGGGWPSWRLNGVGAILALSPVCQPFLKSGALNALAAPVSYQGGTRDLGITPSVKRPGGCYDKSAKPTQFVEFEGAGHAAWTDRPSPASENIAFYALAFFDANLRGQSAADLQQKRPGVSDLRWK